MDAEDERASPAEHTDAPAPCRGYRVGEVRHLLREFRHHADEAHDLSACRQIREGIDRDEVQNLPPPRIINSVEKGIRLAICVRTSARPTRLRTTKVPAAPTLTTSRRLSSLASSAGRNDR
jgi:hypothetical protein